MSHATRGLTDDERALMTHVADDRAERCAMELLAAWMIHNGFATGHGDSISELIRELDWQLREERRRHDQP